MGRDAGGCFAASGFARPGRQHFKGIGGDDGGRKLLIIVKRFKVLDGQAVLNIRYPLAGQRCGSGPRASASRCRSRTYRGRPPAAAAERCPFRTWTQGPGRRHPGGLLHRSASAPRPASGIVAIIWS